MKPMTGYSEQDGQVVLRMSREDYETLLFQLGIAAGWAASRDGASGVSVIRIFELLNRLNSGNPDYTAHPTGEKS